MYVLNEIQLTAFYPVDTQATVTVVACKDKEETDVLRVEGPSQVYLEYFCNKSKLNI